jgi:hypothetical protein
MDFSPGEGSTSVTSHILLLSDSVVQPSNSNSDTDVSTDVSVAATPQESGTPTGTVVVNSHDRSGTIIARLIWDHIPTTTGAAPNPTTATAVPFQTITTHTRRLPHHRELPLESPSDTSRADTETEDEGDINMDQMIWKKRKRRRKTIVDGWIRTYLLCLLLCLLRHLLNVNYRHIATTITTDII